ncbi:MAG: RNA-binding S4 domain-containing protein [Peptoniphilus sp.]|nr:RNA-binding S4 domain-containing protein [Peptoniphilus sp.]
MRIDKFLKVSRIIIRRPIAKKACDGGRVKINGKVAKAGDDVKVGDILEISFGSGTNKYEILDIKEQTAKNDAANLYKIID